MSDTRSLPCSHASLSTVDVRLTQIFWLCLFFVLCFTTETALAETRLLRFPDVHKDRIVFCYAGDLWIGPVDGGTAQRLTAHPGLELFPKFSPDGSTIAFTGQYDGDEQVYVVPTSGGIPKQLTFYPARGPLPDRWGYDNQVYGWTVDGSAVLFRSLRYAWGLTDSRLFTVRLAGGLPEPLPMRVSGAGDYAPSGQQIAFSPLVRDFRTWKRYQGGWAQDLFIFDLKTNEYEQITDHPRTDRDPMWIGDRVYFCSDRDGTLNLYFFDTQTKQTQQVTRSRTFDVRWPSKGEDAIVYELGGSLHVLDIRTGDSRRISFDVPTDGLALRPRRTSAANLIEDYNLAPKGERVVLTARGDVFTVPIEYGPVRNLTRSSNAHEKWAEWSPDGRHIAYISDASGEEEIYLIDPLGKESPVQLTRDGQAMRYEPRWSPNSKYLAFSDKNGKLYVLEIETRRVQEVADNPEGELRDYVWSPQGEYLAFSMGYPNDQNAIYIWSLKDRELRQITDETFNCYSPTWGSDSKYLYYLSDREFAPQISAREWNYAQARQTSILAVALQKDAPPLFPPRSDEVQLDEEAEDKPSPDSDAPQDDGPRDPKRRDETPAAGRKAKADKDHEDTEQIAEAEEQEESEQPLEFVRKDESLVDALMRFFDEADHPRRDANSKDKPQRSTAENESPKEGQPTESIDFAGLRDRVMRIPVEADNLGGLTAVEGHLLYARSGPFFYGRDSGQRTELRVFSLKERKDAVLADGINGFTVSRDGKKVLVRGDQGFRLLDVGMTKSEGKPVNTSALSVTIDPRQEWRQIFYEVWRRFRDFFYVENMHGYNWEALRERYEPLLDHVAHRSDLNYVIGEMIAELNVGHAYIASGDLERPSRPDVALPGAIFRWDARVGKYLIDEIYPGHNEEPIYRSPLTEVGVDAQAGDYVLAIDGEPLTENTNPYELLRFKSAQPVTLRLSVDGSEAKARDVSFNPLKDETNLVYLRMVLQNMEKVRKATQGEVGYLHIPDMGANGIREFNKWFYGQVRKQGLIIDVRTNGGGNVSQMILERLQRKLLATGFPRNDETTNTYPYVVFHGHMACLLDEDSASDGDIFPAMFREAKLGPLIGKRSWGGVIGITNRGSLIDGGSVSVPEFGFASVDGEWIIEGVGVEPDIEVENDPKSLIEGRDPQLERAILEVQRAIRKAPKRLPTRSAPPDKTERPDISS